MLIAKVEGLMCLIECLLLMEEGECSPYIGIATDKHGVVYKAKEAFWPRTPSLYPTARSWIVCLAKLMSDPRECRRSKHRRACGMTLSTPLSGYRRIRGLRSCHVIEKPLPISSRNIEYGGMTLRRRDQ